jgi:hypothetical protein
MRNDSTARDTMAHRHIVRRTLHNHDLGIAAQTGDT